MFLHLRIASPKNSAQSTHDVWRRVPEGQNRVAHGLRLNTQASKDTPGEAGLNCTALLPPPASRCSPQFLTSYHCPALQCVSIRRMASGGGESQTFAEETPETRQEKSGFPSPASPSVLLITAARSVSHLLDVFLVNEAKARDGRLKIVECLERASPNRSKTNNASAPTRARPVSSVGKKALFHASSAFLTERMSPSAQKTSASMPSSVNPTASLAQTSRSRSAICGEKGKATQRLARSPGQKKSLSS